jgi:hypothetical protein
MTPARAYWIASQWGSYINTGDPGACLYYTQAQISRMETGLAMGTVEETIESESDLKDLQALLAWFKACEVLA